MQISFAKVPQFSLNTVPKLVQLQNNTKVHTTIDCLHLPFAHNYHQSEIPMQISSLTLRLHLIPPTRTFPKPHSPPPSLSDCTPLSSRNPAADWPWCPPTCRALPLSAGGKTCAACSSGPSIRALSDKIQRDCFRFPSCRHRTNHDEELQAGVKAPENPKNKNENNSFGECKPYNAKRKQKRERKTAFFSSVYGISFPTLENRSAI